MAIGQNGQSLCDRLFTLMSGGMKQDWCVDSQHNTTGHYYTLDGFNPQLNEKVAYSFSRFNKVLRKLSRKYSQK